jgi:release factor glutamine methyltransferase
MDLMNALTDSGTSALIALGQALRESGYRFITPTPLTHQRVNQRPANRTAFDLAGAFGWSRPFAPELLPAAMRAHLEQAGCMIELPDGKVRSTIRFSTLGAQLFAHSAFPTDAPDSVFFGPDTYRFAQLLALTARPAGRAIDLGCGSGAGGLSIADRVQHLKLIDINPRALELARVNAALNGLANVEFAQGDLYAPVSGEVDLIVANPPYLADDAGRAYRDGGAHLGTALSCRIVAEGIPRLRAEGQLILYSASPISQGRDLLWEQVEPLLDPELVTADYRELDPDVFGEELERPAYAGIDRIAVVALELFKR